MRYASVAFLALGACTWPTSDEGYLVAGTVALVNEAGAALAQAGPYVSVIDRLSIGVSDASGQTIGSASIPLQRYDSTASTTIELPQGLATFTAEVHSNNGALLYTGTTTAEVREGFTIQIPIVAQRSVLVVQPDTLKTTAQTSGVFTLHNAGSQPLVWNLSSIDPRLCNDGCRVTPESGTIAAHQNATFRADVFSGESSRVLSFTVSSAEGDVPVRWAYTRPTVTSVTVAPATALVAVQQQVTLTATVQPATGTPVFWSSSAFPVASVSGGVVLGRGSGTATITAASEVDVSISGTATVRVYGTFLTNFSITAPAAFDTVSRDVSADSVVTLRAVYTASPTFPTPFTLVEFWGRPSGAGTWIRLAQTSSFTLADNGSVRTWTYQGVWNPTVPTAPYPNPSLTRLDLIAIGISSTNSVSASPFSNRLWVRIP
jgi:hypothetical protein